MIHTAIKISIVLSLSLILIAQVLFLPVTLSLIFALNICAIWVSLSHPKPLAKAWAFLFVILALVGIYFSHKSFIGVDAGVAVLSTFLFAKALESKNKRDLIILFNFALFVAASSFLFNQSLWMAIVVILSALSCLIGLYRIQRSEFVEFSNQQKITLKQDAKHVGKLLILAFPFFLLLFIFFPRLPPLWHIPIPENRAMTGISDSMSPGDIAQLSQSSALAFRIIGDVQQLPPPSELYWRALVLDEYDGQRWTSGFINQQPSEQVSQATEILRSGWEYQYLAADPTIRWVMGLEKSVPIEKRYYSRQDWGIVPWRLTQRAEPIKLRWVGVQADHNFQQPTYIQRNNTKFQDQLDPKAQSLAQSLYQASHEDPKRYVQNVLNWYKSNQFVYTLAPGLLGKNRIDEFLFGSKQGFCEHYAASFVMLMRYVGIPARVVTGYQGGQLAPDGKSWEVRQLDAHAWTEVLLNGQWQRIDPTAIIAPQRIDTGMQSFIEQDNRILGERSSWAKQRDTMLIKLRVWSDYTTYQWQSKVVGYNAESQSNWMSKLGLHSSYAGILVIVIGIVSILVLYFIWIYWITYRAQSRFEREIHRLNKMLSPQLKRQYSETVRHWMLNLSEQVPSKDRVIFLQAIQLYDQSMYAPQHISGKELKKFKDLMKCCAKALKKL